ncbi:glycosyltransferase family 2 protein [Prevotella sp.]|uniref:glycosyltransferase family 2 protein n=1 Tax=Prevotella sp. TaxID=59823 RepID=UPI002649D72B|nr:glycosyltransferase family 2 protein [Prevotella sp.]MDN5554910.1 glycosyltransferase [Prevotella sp.]
MRITLITSCYNREATIGRTIESVLCQDYPDIEYIIVDGASKDGTMNVVNQYNDKITKIISEPDHGMYEAINKGISIATGDIIGLVHSDDELYNEHIISDIVRRFEITDADFLYANGIYYNTSGNPVRKWKGGNYRGWKAKLAWLPLHTTTFIKKDIYEKYGYYDESFKIAADTDLMIRLLHDNELKVTYLDEYVVKMLMGGLSTGSGTRKKMLKEDLRIFREHNMKPTLFFKICKMAWKIPQFIEAKFIS